MYEVSSYPEKLILTSQRRQMEGIFRAHEKGNFFLRSLHAFPLIQKQKLGLLQTSTKF